MIDRVHNKAKISVEKYRAARIAKLALAGTGEWENMYRVLNDADVRGYQDPEKLQVFTGCLGVWEDEQVMQILSEGSSQDALLDNADFLFQELRGRRDGTGETRHTLSWIWTSAMLGDPDDVNNDYILRVEWSKSRARVVRAKEEVLLLQEEMRRVLAYLEWKVRWWTDRQSLRQESKHKLAEGIKGYTNAQAEIQAALADHFKTLWASPLQDPVSTSSFLPAEEDVEEGDNDGDTHDEDDQHQDQPVDEEQFKDDEISFDSDDDN